MTVCRDFPIFFLLWGVGPTPQNQRNERYFGEGSPQEVCPLIVANLLLIYPRRSKVPSWAGLVRRGNIGLLASHYTEFTGREGDKHMIEELLERYEELERRG